MVPSKFLFIYFSCSPIMTSVLIMIGILIFLNKGMWNDHYSFHLKWEVKSSNPFCSCKVFHYRWFSFEKEWLSFFLRWWNPSNTKSSLIQGLNPTWNGSDQSLWHTIFILCFFPPPSSQHSFDWTYLLLLQEGSYSLFDFTSTS
jgi:hypothetical protein